MKIHNIHIEYKKWYEKNRSKILNDFLEYLSINTVSPNEKEAFDFLDKNFKDLGFVTWKEQITEEAINNYEHCPFPMGKITSNDYNFKASIGEENKKKLLISCHIDVVPPCGNRKSTFIPIVEKDENGSETIFARGACDTKGNLLMLLVALRFLRDMKIPLKYAIEFDGVVEEETGGIGGLSTAIRKKKKNDIDGVIVLEPTNLNVYRGHRGCLGVTIKICGESTHMGMANRSAPIDVVGDLVLALKKLEQNFNDIAKKGKGYEMVHRPIQINIGKIYGGEWHGSSMSECVLAVNVGFPHELDLKKTEKELSSILDDLSEKTNLKFELKLDGIRNEAYFDEENDGFYYNFKKYVDEVKLQRNEIGAWLVSCDARSYVRYMNVPTLIFGCGKLQYAHSSDEKISMSDIKKAAYILVKYLSDSV